MPAKLMDDKSTLVQVMAWCRQATSHYLSQCWLRFMSPYDATRPQWVKVNYGVFFVSTNCDLCSVSVSVGCIQYRVALDHVTTAPGSICATSRSGQCWGYYPGTLVFNTLRRQNGCHFPDDIFLNENLWISIEISLRFVPKCVQLTIFHHWFR